MAERRPRLARQPGLAPRRPCPVCLGTLLKPRAVEGGPDLDICERCGGVWFDAGEVHRLRGARPDALWARVELAEDAFRMKCHRCRASFPRSRPDCPACGWVATLACPACRTTMRVVERDGLRIDVCTRCRGAWFDNTELREIWNRKVEALAPARRGAPATVRQDHFLLDALIWAPDPFLLGYVAASGIETAAAAAPLAAEAAGSLLGGAGDVLGGAVEHTTELASGVFGAIADLIGGLFDGL